MSNLVRQNNSVVTNSVVTTGYFNPDQVRLIKRTIMDESATDDDLALFGQICARLGLDPFAKQINAIKRGWGQNEKWSFEPTIDGYRAVADSTGNYGGSECYWCSSDGTWVDVWLKDELPAAAKCIVWRKDSDKPFIAVAKFNSYKGTKKDGSLNSIWKKFPDLMIAKCAESLALRKAFPRQLSGVHTQEEMNQAESLQEKLPQPQNKLGWDIKQIKPLREALGWDSSIFLQWLHANFGVNHPKELEFFEFERVINELKKLVETQAKEENLEVLFQKTKEENLEVLEKDMQNAINS